MMAGMGEYWNVIGKHWGNILMMHNAVEDKPVMLFDIEKHKIYAYPYEGFKLSLNKRSQRMLEEQYAEALLKNKMVFFVKDNEKRKFISANLDY